MNEYALAQNAPLIKSCSLLPHADVSMYKQAPYQGITRETYLERVKELIESTDNNHKLKKISPFFKHDN